MKTPRPPPVLPAEEIFHSLSKLVDPGATHEDRVVLAETFLDHVLWEKEWLDRYEPNENIGPPPRGTRRRMTAERFARLFPWAVPDKGPFATWTHYLCFLIRLEALSTGTIL